MVAFIHVEWNAQWYVYVPGTVSFTLNVSPLFIICCELAGLAPDGTESHTTSCGADVSWSENVTFVPAATVTVAGEKFNCILVPTPCGITIIVTPDEPDPEELVLAELDEELVPEELVVTDVELVPVAELLLLLLTEELLMEEELLTLVLLVAEILGLLLVTDVVHELLVPEPDRLADDEELPDEDADIDVELDPDDDVEFPEPDPDEHEVLFVEETVSVVDGDELTDMLLDVDEGDDVLDDNEEDTVEIADDEDTRDVELALDVVVDVVEAGRVAR